MTSGVRLFVGLALAALALDRAMADPCAAFHRPAGGRLGQVVAGQLKVPSVDIVDVFRSGRWRLVYIDSHVADPAMLFYAGDPETVRYRTLWSGAARRDEVTALRRWATVHAPRIPPRLATCFAWYVTAGRRR